MSYNLEWTIVDNIGHLVLNDPPANSMNKFFFNRLTYLVNKIIPKSNVQGILIYGKGRHYSSGADINGLFECVQEETIIDKSNNIVEYPLYLKNNNKSFLYLEHLNIPVVSAIRGICLGSAFELALFSHFRFSTKKAYFGFPECTFNLMPGLGGTQKIMSHVKPAKAMEMLLTGSNIDAEEAYQLKIVDKIIDKKEIIDYSHEFIKKITKNYKRELKYIYLKNNDKKTLLNEAN